MLDKFIENDCFIYKEIGLLKQTYLFAVLFSFNC